MKVNLCTTYVNEMSIKCLKSSYLLGEYCCRFQFYFIEYNYMFNILRRNSSFHGFIDLGLLFDLWEDESYSTFAAKTGLLTHKNLRNRKFFTS